MSLTISEHNEVRLIEEGRKQGISVDALLEKFIDEPIGTAATPPARALELPVWRRRDRSPA